MAKLSTKTDGRPAFQFYPDDWTDEPALKLCSLAARGLWIEMVCRMFKSPRRGYLLKPNGSKLEAKHLAKLAGTSEQEASNLLAELEENEVFSSDEDGTIYSRRMIRDEALRLARAEAGRKGGRSKQPSKAEANAKQNDPPSSSPPSSSSSPSSRSIKGTTELHREGELVDNSPVIPSSIEDQDPESPTGSPGTENQAPHAPQDGPSVVVDQPPPPEAGRAPRAKRGAEASQNGARRQTPEQMLRDMAYQRGVAFDDLVALAGGPPPWRHTVVTKIRRFLETMPKLAEAEIDLRIRARRTAAAGAARDGPQPLGDILRSALPPEATP